MITREYEAKSSTLKAKYSGNLTLDELLEYINHLSESDEYDRRLYIFTDGFEAKVDFPVDAIESIMELTAKTLQRYASVREAILIDNPLETAYATHYQSMNEISNYAVRVFSTVEAAREWLATGQQVAIRGPRLGTEKVPHLVL